MSPMRGERVTSSLSTGQIESIRRRVVAIVAALCVPVALVALVALPAAPALAQEGDRAALPALSGRVVDLAGLLDPAREAALTDRLAQQEASGGDQIVVATVPSLEGRDIAGYAIELSRAWQLGTARNDNGVLLLVAPEERKVRIEVGRGLEGALTDVRAGLIVRQDILPAFRDGDYAGGIERGVDAIIASIAGEYRAAPAGSSGAASAGPLDTYMPLLFIGMIGVPQLLRRTGLRKAANGAFPAGFVGLFATVLTGTLWIGLAAAVAVFLLVTITGAGGGGGSSGARRRTGYVGPVGGGFGGGFGGGGGFSGGGGGFGGGGASGSW